MKILRFVAIALLIAVAAASQVQAQAAGSTAISVTLPDVIILHYFSTMDISLTAAAINSYLYATTPVDQGNAAPAAGGFSQSLAISPTAPTGSVSAAVLTLTNAWAVRAVLATGRLVHVAVTLSATPANLTLTNPGGGTMVITAGSTSTADFAPPGLASTTSGNVLLTLNLTDAIRSGKYSGPGVTTQFTVTASST